MRWHCLCPVRACRNWNAHDVPAVHRARRLQAAIGGDEEVQPMMLQWKIDYVEARRTAKIRVRREVPPHQDWRPWYRSCEA